MKFVTLSLIETSRGQFNEDTGREDVIETVKPVVINTAAIRCFYARKDGKPGTRLTFTDGGGFAVSEAPDAVAALAAGGDINPLALAAPASNAAN